MILGVPWWIVIVAVASGAAYLLGDVLDAVLDRLYPPPRPPSREDLALSMLRERFARDEISQLQLEQGIDEVLAGRIPDDVPTLLPTGWKQVPIPPPRLTAEEQSRRAYYRREVKRAAYKYNRPGKVICDGCGYPTIPHRGLRLDGRDVTYCDACWAHAYHVAREAIIPEPGYEVPPPSDVVTSGCGCIIAERPREEA